MDYVRRYIPRWRWTIAESTVHKLLCYRATAIIVQWHRILYRASISGVVDEARPIRLGDVEPM